MARVCFTFCFVLMQWPIFVLGNDFDNLTSSIVNETHINVTVPIPIKSRINVTTHSLNETYINVTTPIPIESHINVTTNSLNETYINGSDPILNDPILAGLDPKSMLRYGHHRTYECLDFTEAYKCIAKCLRKGFDIAVANKSCSCNCLIDKQKAKYHKISTEYRYPTTTKPAWAVSSTVEVTTVMPGKVIVIGGEYVYYQSGEGNSSEAKDTLNESDDESSEHTSKDQSCFEYSSDEHNSDEHGSEEHESEEHGSEEHGSEEHGSEEHGSEEHGSEEHGSEEHASEDHNSEEHHSEEAEEAAEERADVGAEND